MFMIRLLGQVDGTPTPHDGKLLKFFDPARGRVGLGHVVTTDDPEEAERFPKFEDVHRCWTRIDPRQPTRPWDGKPNRPLTRFNMETVRVEVDDAPDT